MTNYIKSKYPQLCIMHYALFIILLLAGCTHVAKENLLADQMPQASLTEQLAVDICKVSDSIDPQEAYKLAHTAITKAHELAQSYAMASPPEYHNFLVNIGAKDRGLCWHWAQDLLTAFLALNLQTIDFRWAEANRGSNFYEHNVVVITAYDKTFADGLIYDPWRTAGKPYWIFMHDDVKYQWQEFTKDKW